MKRKTNALLLSVLLVLTVVFLTNPVYAVSTGYERYKDDECEIYLEYFPIVPFDPYYPTASEEFAIKFHIWQNAWWNYINKVFPRGFEIKVYYRCDSCGYPDYVSWKKWYPTSTDQYGLDVNWHLSDLVGGPLSVTVNGPEVFGYDRNYDEYDEDYEGKTYLHVGDLSSTYRSAYTWGSVDVHGGGSIGIQNDAAQNHQGHHVLIWVHVTLYWLEYDWWQHTERYRHYDFVLGDDTPADTDCWLTVEEGTVAFGNPYYLTISAESGGTTKPPPRSYVYDKGTSVDVTASPYSHYAFDYWILDGATMYDNPITATMNSDHTLKAYFSFYNNAPNTPSKPSGPTYGYVGTYYSYSTKTTDADGDKVKYKFDWGDGSYTYTGYYSSGVTVSRSHKWSTTEYKYVRVKACDEYGKWSGWSSSLRVWISSGGGGCPILSVYDGSEYVEEGLLDIHNPEGVDMVYEHTLVTMPERVDGAYLMRLTEHPKTHSFIDQVKLYAMLEDGTLKELPLIWACHSEEGNVLPMLLHSDEWKADTLGADHNDGTSQSIDLKFAALSPNLEVTGFMFQIEGNNRWEK